MKATHAMHASSGRSGRGTDVDVLIGCGIRIGPGNRSNEHLAQVLEPAIDVSADKIFVVRLKSGGIPDMAGEDGYEGDVVKLVDLFFKA